MGIPNTVASRMSARHGGVGLGSSGEFCWVRGQDHAGSLRSFPPVRVSEDVAVRIDNDAGANRMMTGIRRCGLFMIFQGRTQPDNLDDAGDTLPTTVPESFQTRSKFDAAGLLT